LAEPEGYVRVFVDEGERVRKMLSTAGGLSSVDGATRAYVARLLTHFGTPPPAQGALSRGALALVEPLSERELEVLHLIAAGHSGQEIAHRLYLALSTVQWHSKNIYSKLNVHSRTQAIARARELSLLS
jgi:LuxR family maltose regulon positive regulatory protein